MGTSCTNSSTAGSSGAPIFLSGKGDTITGIVHSNGTVYEQGKSQTMNGASATYGTGCTPSISSGSTAVTAGTTSAPWPNNYYSTTFPACSGSSCTGPCPTTTCTSSSNHTPSYCTSAATSYAVTTALSSGVYCAVGTGNPNDPSTYTGLFQDETSTAQTHVTALAGAWQCTVSGCTESAYGADPVICAASTNANAGTSDGVSVDMQTSGESITGAIFAPNGTIEWNGDGSNGTFLEAQQVFFEGGSQTILGDGPTGASSISTQGTDNLTQ